MDRKPIAEWHWTARRRLARAQHLLEAAALSVDRRSAQGH